MTKFSKRQKAFEAWANPLLEKTRKVTLLTHFSPMQFEYKPRDCKDGVFMLSATVYPYQSVYIRYGDEALEYWDKKDFIWLKKALIHEVIHQLTDPLFCVATDRYVVKDQITNEREKLTDHIANIIFNNELI